MRPLFCLAIAALALGFAPAPIQKPVRERDPSKADLARLQGTWVLEAYHLGELTIDATGTLDVKGSQVDYVFVYSEAKRGVAKMRFEVDARVTPRSWTERSATGDPVTTLLRMIYAIEGNRLTVGSSVDSARTATSLNPGPGRVILVYRRARPE